MASYLELSFELGQLDADAVDATCRACGALALTYTDAHDEPVLEPLPGELRLWRSTRVQALFAAEQAGIALLTALAQALQIDPARLETRAVADRVWEREWLRDFHAMRFGRRLWICPHHEQVEQAGAAVLRLDPGLAFGTGTHPTTAMCLEWLDERFVADSVPAASPVSSAGEVIDYGCGSGVLGLAALRLGASRLYAFDIDPQALLATRQNAEDNGLGAQLVLCERAEQVPQGRQLLMANILGTVLLSLAPQFAALLTAGSRVLLSGILSSEQHEIAAAFTKCFDMEVFREREGWVALSGRRHSRAG